MRSLHASAASTACRYGPRAAGRQCGLTLVELLVALAISSIVAIAAISALIVSRQGLTTIDAASQLRDNARFAADLIQRLGVQAGYEDFIYATTTRLANVVGVATNPDSDVAGFNNAISSYTDPYNTATARTAGTVGYGSDVLILRYQASETLPGSGVSDKTMIDCSGSPSTAIPANRDDRMVSVLYVDISQGEPSLMCSTGPSTAQPIVQGVENFQVLYGVDNVTPNTAPGSTTTDSVADRFLRADQMVVTGDPIGTNANWRRVRALRIGMVIRGPLGSAQDTTAQTLYPLGQAKNASGGSPGSAMSSSSDPGTIFSPGADSRMRQAVTFTVHLRNEQGL